LLRYLRGSAALPTAIKKDELAHVYSSFDVTSKLRRVRGVLTDIFF